MRFTLKIMLFISVILTSFSSIAQEHLTQQQVATYKTMHNEAKGTYQIQIVNTRQIPAIPLSIIQVVEENRHLTDTIYVDYSSHMRIMILPKDIINSGQYTPLRQTEYVSQ